MNYAARYYRTSTGDRYTRKVLERVPEDKLDGKPIPSPTRSAGR